MRSAPKPHLRGTVLMLAASLAMPSVARADEKQACSAAYDSTQALRAAGKLSTARQQAAACTRDACAEFIRTDCARWLGELDASQPTVVLRVRDFGGHETGAVRVDLDGAPWLASLDGKAKPVDPGPHTLRYVLADGSSHEDAVQIREGEKNRALDASFTRAAPDPARLPPLAAPPAAEPPRRSLGPWIVGGVGIVGLAAAGVLGGLLLHDKALTGNPAVCDGMLAKPMCTSAGVLAEQQGSALGPATTVSLVVGSVGVAAAAVWLIVRGPASAPVPVSAVGMGPALTVDGGRWTFRGSW